MIDSAAPDAAAADAELSLYLFARNPLLFGGIMLRGDGPVRDEMVEFARKTIGQFGPVLKIPANVDSDRLLGGLDLAATLASGASVRQSGLLDSATGGGVIVPMAERIRANVAAHISQAIDRHQVAVILLDDSYETDEAPPLVLTERLAFHCDVSTLRRFSREMSSGSNEVDKVAALTDEQLHAIALTATALGIGSARALNFANAAARAHAALYGRTVAVDQDIAAAVRLVLAPRAVQLPEMEPPPVAEPAEERPQDNQAEDQDKGGNPEDIDLEDIVLAAAAAAIPKHILDQIDHAAKGAGKGQAGRSGQKQKSFQRGRPLGSRPGVPGHGKRLSLIDSLRAAAPWQKIRRQASHGQNQRNIQIRTSDLRVRHYEQRRESLTIFAVDASGSSAMSRLAEAKGAVELMLAQAYVKRSQVALIAFRQLGAELLLPPTRSLTRARRALAALPGGGGTPLAAGLLAAHQLAEAARRHGQTPMLAVLTDGKGNIAMDGSANRDAAMDDAKKAARSITALGLNCLVIDISPRPRAEAAELAHALNGRYLPLPQAHSAAMVAAIEGLTA